MSAIKARLFIGDISGPGNAVAISCEVDFDRELGKWRAVGSPTMATQEFEVFAETKHAAVLGCFAKWLGVSHDLRDTLVEVDR